MVDKKLQEVANAIKLTTRTVKPEHLPGVHASAHNIADVFCTPASRFHFLLLCNVPFTL